VRVSYDKTGLKSLDIAVCSYYLLSFITSDGVTGDRMIFVDECRRFRRTCYLDLLDSAIKRLGRMGRMY